MVRGKQSNAAMNKLFELSVKKLTNDAIRKLLDQGADVNGTDAESRTPLQMAAQYGRLSSVQVLLQQGADVNHTTTNDGLAVFHFAAQRKDTSGETKEIMKHLKAAGAQVNAQDTTGMSPLMYAVSSSFDVTTLLLQHGADVNQLDKRKQNALFHLTKTKISLDCLEELLKHGACVNARNIDDETVLIKLMKSPDEQKIRTKQARKQQELDTAALFERILKSSEPGFIELSGVTGKSALAYACESKELSTMQLLLDRRANKNGVGPCGRTPLMVCALVGFQQGVDLLLERKSNVNGKDFDGNTALFFAAISNSVDCCKSLVEKEANVNHKNFDDITPVMAAAMFGSVDAFKFLSPKAALHDVDGYGDSVIHFSVLSRSKPMLKAALKALAKPGVSAGIARSSSYLADDETEDTLYHSSGDTLAEADDDTAFINLQNHRGFTALSLAVKNSDEELTKKLLAAKSDVNKADELGNTALFYCAQAGNLNILKMLLAKKTNIDHRNKAKQTALMYAAYFNSQSIFTALLEVGSQSHDLLEAKDENGNTALTYAVRRNNGKIAEYMLSKNVKQTPNNHGHTPLMVAAAHDAAECANLLLFRRAKLHDVDTQGRTALKIASQFDSNQVLNILARQLMIKNRESLNEKQTSFHKSFKFPEQVKSVLALLRAHKKNKKNKQNLETQTSSCTEEIGPTIEEKDYSAEKLSEIEGTNDQNHGIKRACYQ